MRFKKVLLVNPFYSSYRFSIPVVPPGLGYLAEFLSRNGVEVGVLDMALGYGPEDLRRRISDFKPDLVGVSMMTCMYERIYSWMREVRSAFPDLPIVVGGPHVSSLRENVLKACEAVDFGVTLEGEHTLLDLCQGKALGDIKGLLYRDAGEIRYTGMRGFVEDLDSLPWPRYEAFELEKYGLGMSIVTSRGCPYRCVYCSCNVIGKKYRTRTPVSVLEEISYWHAKGFREFGFQEDNPTGDMKRMSSICDLLLENHLEGLSLMAGNGARADRVDRPLLEKMRKAGFKRLAFGIEAGNDRILKNLRKGEAMASMDVAVKDSCELGFFVSLFFLVGSPGETPADVEDSIRFSLKYPASDVIFYNLVPMPDTELAAWVREHGRFLAEPEVYLNQDPFPSLTNDPVFETPEFPREERVRLLRRTKEVSREVRRALISRRLTPVTRLSGIIAYLYTREPVQRLDRALTANPWGRALVAGVRNAARKAIYG
jgi:radical SAM superfamily enzyme YgiQ (UPF0313 family)